MYKWLNNEAEQLVRAGYEKFYIYPTGDVGMQIKRILDVRFGKETILVDNKLSTINTKILKLEDIKETDEKAILLVASVNQEISTSLLIELQKNVINIPIKELLPGSSESRITQLALCAKEIYKHHVQGAVAEAGVYKGEFAKYINMLFPDRKCYLFDSFEGFDANTVVDEFDNTKQTDIWIGTLKDTSISLVMSKMRYAENIIVKKGFFPESAAGINDMFAYVSLDMDIYLPTYEGLHFFWDRLSPGGYIFVHDYGHWDGIEGAVLKFCRERGASYMPIMDNRSVVIAKPLA